MVSEARGISSVREMRSVSRDWRVSGEDVGLVPTMGALHEGHLSLVRQAREECDRVVVSVFVNPTQFGRGEDFDTYPRDFDRDGELLAAAGCDAIFAPGIEEMYGESGADLSSGSRAYVEGGKLGEVWEGEHRPGHFRGVATVVMMLFNATVPHRAYFGEKDYQQLKVIQKMARDLLTGVEVVGCPTVREEDGLAMSSRNANLSTEERKAAVVLSRALREGARLAQSGVSNVSDLEAAMREVVREEPLAALQYLAVVDPNDLSRLESLESHPARAIIAARLGNTRLIDNAEIRTGLAWTDPSSSYSFP